MQSSTSRNIDQCYYYGNQLVYASLYKVSKDSKVEEPKTKAQKLKSPNLNNFSKFDQSGNAKTSNMARKVKKKQQKKEKRNKKDLNADTPASEINATNNSNGKKHIKQDLNQVTCWNCDKKDYYSHNCPKSLKNKKKLLAVLATSALVTKASTENPARDDFAMRPLHLIFDPASKEPGRISGPGQLQKQGQCNDPYLRSEIKLCHKKN